MLPKDWEQLPYFLSVARLGTLRQAADEMGATHGTVKRQIEALEVAYGVQLFRRTRKGLKLTDAGENLIPIAEEADRLVGAARHRLQGFDRDEQGAIRFSVTGTMAYDIIAPMMVRFFTAYPDIDVQIQVTDRFEDINKLETDVSLRYADCIRENVVARRLFNLTLNTFASQTYLDQHLGTVSPTGKGLHWIGFDSIDPKPEWVKSTDFPDAEVRHATTDHIYQLSLVRRGFGMIRTSVYFAHLYPELVAVPGAVARRDRPLWILRHTELKRTARVRRFVDFLTDELNALKPLLVA